MLCVGELIVEQNIPLALLSKLLDPESRLMFPDSRIA